MSEVVLDASALLAVMRNEPGAIEVERCLNVSIISAVNLSEVVAKAIDYGGTLEAVSVLLDNLPIQTVAFTREDAYVAASLRSLTKHKGLSLGDRSCLALGLRRGLPVFTTERSWADLEVAVTINLIR